MPNLSVPAAAPGLPLEARRMFLAAGPVAAVFGALAYAKLDALLVAPALSPELVRLIEAHRVARGAIFAAFDVYCDVLDGLRSDLCSEDATDRYIKAGDAEVATLGVLCRYSCHTHADARAWARHLFENEEIIDERDLRPAVQGLARLLAATEEDL